MLFFLNEFPRLSPGINIIGLLLMLDAARRAGEGVDKELTNASKPRGGM